MIAVIVPVILVAAVGEDVAVVVVIVAMVEVAGVAVAEGIRSSAKRVLAF